MATLEQQAIMRRLFDGAEAGLNEKLDLLVEAGRAKTREEALALMRGEPSPYGCVSPGIDAPQPGHWRKPNS